VITVVWPSAIARDAQIWRLLDLSGMTKSVRESRNFTRAGYLYLNGNKVSGLKALVSVGSQFTLEIRFPNGKITSRDIHLVLRPYYSGRKQRSSDPRTLNYRG
jgi:hypothetical protein